MCDNIFSVYDKCLFFYLIVSRYTTERKRSVNEETIAPNRSSGSRADWYETASGFLCKLKKCFLHAAENYTDVIYQKKKKRLVQVKAFEGICSKNAKSFQNPSLLGNPTCDWVQACLQWGEFWLHGIIHREMQIIWTLWRVKHKLLFLKAQSVRFRESLHLAGMNWR